MMLSAIIVYQTNPNLITAVLSVLLGICAVAFCLLLGMHMLRALSQKNKMSADEYHLEERKAEEGEQVKKPRHSKKRKHQKTRL